MSELNKKQIRRKLITKAVNYPNIFILRLNSIYWILEYKECFSDSIVGYEIPTQVAEQLIKNTSIQVQDDNWPLSLKIQRYLIERIYK